MENTDAHHQLPEVDALPDGFVDSPEPPAPQTPTPGKEKPLTEHNQDSILKISHSNESQACQRSNENTSKDRMFPVPLHEADGFKESTDPLECSAEVSDKGLSAQRNSALPLRALDNVVSNDCTVVETGGEVPECQGSSEKSSEGALVEQAEKVKETPPIGNVQLQKGRPLETVENKRKNSKKTSLSEKEILEFTLKYQQVLAERDAAITVRDKLESLCRELQRQNKMLMDECKRVSTEGQSMRLDLSARFQDAIKDVNAKLEEQKVECFSQLKENEMLRNKLTQLADQYNLAEQQFAQKLKQKSLELELADLKIKQHEEKIIQEQSQIKVYADQVSQLLTIEKTLRLQLTTDGEKFQQFQEALVKSNEVFETFKQEIEKMAKSIKDLKKENLFLKSKCEKSDVTLIELVEEREKLKKQLEKTKNQKEKLESLCRSLQAERKQKSTESNCSDAVPA